MFVFVDSVTECLYLWTVSLNVFLKEIHIAQSILLNRQSVPPDGVTQTMNRKLHFFGDAFEQIAIENGIFQPISYVFSFVLRALMPS
jgi:hypothetical protein